MNVAKTAGRDAPFVTLGIGAEILAVPVAAVVEILDMRPVSRVPEAPAYLAGLIDARGRGVPVIDLRVRLGLPAVAATAHTRIVVMDIVVGGRRIIVGLLADRVFEVLALDPGQLEAAPDIGVAWRSDYIQGVGRRGDDFVIVLDLARLFSPEDAAALGTGTMGLARSAPDHHALAAPERSAA